MSGPGYDAFVDLGFCGRNAAVVHQCLDEDEEVDEQEECVRAECSNEVRACEANPNCKVKGGGDS